MTFFKWDSPDEGGSVVSSYIWIYFLITALFTAVTLVLWWYFLVYRAHKTSSGKEDDDEEEEKEEEAGTGLVERCRTKLRRLLRRLIAGKFGKGKEEKRQSATPFAVEP